MNLNQVGRRIRKGKGRRLVEWEIRHQFGCMKIKSGIHELVQHRKCQRKNETVNDKKVLELETNSGRTSHVVFTRRPSTYFGRYRQSRVRNEDYHYDIDIYRTENNKSSSEKRKRMRRDKKRKIVKTILSTQDIFKDMGATFDGDRNLYTKQPLPINSEVIINIACDNDTFTIKIKPASKKKFTYTFLSQFSVYNLHPKFMK